MSLDWKTAVPWFLTLATITAGIWQYGDKQAQTNREPFLMKQLDLVFEATEVVGTLSTTTDPEIWHEKRERFWQLYWGSLGVVEDPEMELAMVQAGDVILPTEPLESPELPFRALCIPSLNLSHAARKLILKSWNVSLPALQGTRMRAEK